MEDYREHLGIQRLIEHYRSVFKTRENLDHYSSEDYRMAERKFLKYALNGWEVPGQEEAQEEDNAISPTDTKKAKKSHEDKTNSTQDLGMAQSEEPFFTQRGGGSSIFPCRSKTL